MVQQALRTLARLLLRGILIVRQGDRAEGAESALLNRIMETLCLRGTCLQVCTSCRQGWAGSVWQVLNPAAAAG